MKNNIEYKDLDYKNKKLCEEFLLDNNKEVDIQLKESNHVYFNINLKSNNCVSPVKNYINNKKDESPGKFSKFHKKCVNNSIEKQIKLKDNLYDVENNTKNKNNKIYSKLDLITKYQEYFSIQFDKILRVPNLLTRNLLVEKIEFIYEHVTKKVFKNKRKGLKFGVMIIEALNIKYKSNISQVTQILINILYSCEKYKERFIEFSKFLDFLTQCEESSLYFYLYIRYYLKLSMNINFHSLGANNKIDPEKWIIKFDIALKVVENTFNFNNQKCYDFIEKFKSSFNKKTKIEYYEFLNFVDNELNDEYNSEIKKIIFYNFYEKELIEITPKKKKEEKIEIDKTEDFSFNFDMNKAASSKYDLISNNSNLNKNEIINNNNNVNVTKNLNNSFSLNPLNIMTNKNTLNVSRRNSKISLISEFQNFNTKPDEPKEVLILKKYVIKEIKSYVFSLGIMNKEEYEMDTLINKLISKYLLIIDSLIEKNLRKFQRLIRVSFKNLDSENFYNHIIKDIERIANNPNNRELNKIAIDIFREPLLFKKTEFLISLNLENIAV